MQRKNYIFAISCLLTASSNIAYFCLCTIDKSTVITAILTVLLVFVNIVFFFWRIRRINTSVTAFHFLHVIFVFVCVSTAFSFRLDWIDKQIHVNVIGQDNVAHVHTSFLRFALSPLLHVFLMKMWRKCKCNFYIVCACIVKYKPTWCLDAFPNFDHGVYVRQLVFIALITLNVIIFISGCTN